MADRGPLTLAGVPGPSRHIGAFFDDSVEELRVLLLDEFVRERRSRPT